MRCSSLLLLALLLSLITLVRADEAAPAAPTAAEGWRDKGPLAVTSTVATWQDKARKRDIPVRIYCPPADGGPYPVIIFSHGLGGSRDGYAYLGNHWASHGYVVVHITHLGSDTAVWQGQTRPYQAMVAAAADPQAAIDRPRDVTFVLNRLEQLNQTEPPLQGQLDLKRVGVAGHSFGGFTVLASMGETFATKTGRDLGTLGDPRIKAGIAMSPPAKAALEQETTASPFRTIVAPLMVMTGTKDNSPIGQTKAADRRIPYDQAGSQEAYLVTFAGGDHMVFSGGERRGTNAELDDKLHPLILQLTTAFWDAYLRDQRAARTWLAGGDAKAQLGALGVYETRANAAATK